MATLGFRITIDGVDDDTLVVREFKGHESISDSLDWNGQPCFGYRYQIELASRQMDLTAESMVDSTALLEVIRDDTVIQKVHGIIRSFSRGDTGYHHTFYTIILVPALERLALRQNSRIFQQASVPEILSVLLQEMNITDYSFSLKNDYSEREFCVQYRETDLAFFHRLAAEAGLIYTFVHADDKHLLVIADNNDAMTTLEGDGVPYNALSGGTTEAMYVSQFSDHYRAEVSSTALQDYSFKQPAYRFAQSAAGTEMDYQLQTYEHFDHPGRFKSDATGKVINQVRLDYLRRDAHTATGKSNDAQLQAGVIFTLIDHTDTDLNRDWLTVGIDHQGTQPQALEEEGGHGQTSYANQFTVIPSDGVWEATPQPKPLVDGPCIAVVVGPSDEDIYCDEYGRVRVQFPWDRYGTSDENSSCWVRVSQGWAGASYGMMAIPRIGHEVVVEFLNGDPDQPIVTGRKYHATNTPPYTLPDHKTKTVLRTETHQGDGYNELCFEDQSGSEKISIHGQRDYEAYIGNDHTTDIKHDQHLTVENDRFLHIKGDDHLTIKGEQRLSIGGMHSQYFKQSLQQKVSSVTAIQAGNAIHVSAGTKIVIEAGSEVTLKVGSNYVHIGVAGVHITGSTINLNSGGSASSAKSYSGSTAILPQTLDDSSDA